MKSIALAAALSLAATTAFAGSLSEPVVEAPVAEAETGSSAGSSASSGAGVIIPVLLLLAVGAAVAAND